MKRTLLAIALCLAVPVVASAAQPDEPHPDNDIGFPLGVWCAPFFENVDDPPVFDNVQGNRLAINVPTALGDIDDDYAATFCDSDLSGTFTPGDAILCCKRHNGRRPGHGSSANCKSFGVAQVVEVDEDEDGEVDYFLVLINPTGPPDACGGVKQSGWTRGGLNVID